ncbi:MULTISPECIES: CoA pyrophosphatase [unclassified Thalassolituus]|uniref:CoA pyrophosphatase n=1 Tax=unclassified Thalassolituus TaxID=2624967 RepID=UPI0025F0CAC0|nr:MULTISPECIES: CoA pyrophosphatase [unclassified Thalassolituus]
MSSGNRLAHILTRQYNETMNLPLTDYLTARLQQHSPRRIRQPQLAEAGVLVALTDEENPQLLLTLRSSNLSSHKGEVAFPGGKRDPEDVDIIATALREAEEEVALAARDVQVLGELDQVVSRFGYLITPVLAVVPPGLDYQPNPDELDAIFMAPLDLFRQPPSGYFERDNISVPSYDYENFHIWGLTAMVIAEMMNNLWDGNIALRM